MSDSTLAFVFPGQGSQKIGMLADMAAAHPLVLETFEEASQALGEDLWQLVQAGEPEQLNLTHNTQPALLTASVALWRVWREQGGELPRSMAGHSLGEFSALVCAGALDFADGVRLVRQRGQFMQSAVPVGEGTMAAVLGLEDEQIESLCAQAAQDQVVQAVNYNAPGQVVIAGHTAAVERALQLCKEAGAKRALLLAVSAPFHTSLMQPAGEKLEQALANITLREPEVPVVHNVGARPETDPQQIKALLVRQISSPVPWVDCVRYLVERGMNRAVECGPGKVLCGLNKRIDRSLENLPLETPDELQHALGR